MRIIDNRALLLRTRYPERVVEVIPKSKRVGEHDVLVNWGLHEAQVLRNIGFRKVPSPILKDYSWPGMFKPMEHQRKLAAFKTLHRRLFNLSDPGCVDADTEYLSPTGWVKISEYQSGEVAQYHPETGEVSFVTPEAYIRKPCERMYHFKTLYGVDQQLSPEHRMLIHDPQSPHRKWTVMEAQEVARRHDAFHAGEQVPVVGSRKMGTDTVAFSRAAIPATFTHPWGEGLPLTEQELRVQVAVIADGHFDHRPNRHYCVIRVKRQRKIERLHQLLKGIPYRCTDGGDGFQVFSFTPPMRCKEFTPEFYACSARQVEIIADEVLHWDGTLREGERGDGFFSTSKQSADFVQLVFASQGRIARVTEDVRPGRNTCYVVHIRKPGSGMLMLRARGKRTVAEVVPSDGHKYCFTVPTSFLLFRRNGCIFASGNTGKSASSLWAADYLMNLGEVNRVLIVCPLSVMEDAWLDGVFKTIVHRNVVVAHHSSRDKRVDLIRSGAEIVIINYDGIPLVHSELRNGGFDLIIGDEATALKNANIQRWKDFKALLKDDTRLWLLTGTPAAQKPTDAFGLAKLVNPAGVPRSFGAFRDEVMRRVTQFKWVPKHDAKERVFQVLQPAIRFTKEECLDLPDITYTYRHVPMSKQQEKYYNLLKKEMYTLAAGESITAVNAAVMLNKLLQVSSGAVYSDAGDIIEFNCKPRLEETREIIESTAHKTIVFVPFTHAIQVLQEYLTKHGITSGVINGAVSSGRRAELIRAFQTEDDPQVIIIQPQAASHGITLTAADTIVWFGPTSSVETYLQANARPYRKGQTNKVTVYHLHGSQVEDKVYKALRGNVLSHQDLVELYNSVLT